MIPTTKFQLEVVVFCLAIIVICSSNNSKNSPDVSWSRLQISPNELCSMPYKTYRIKIFEHSNNKKSTTIPSHKKYYYAPLGILNHTSAEVFENNAQQMKYQLRFEIEMWNNELEEAVVSYLLTFLDEPIKIQQVEIIPLEKMILKSKGISKDYQISTSWSHYQLDKTMKFSLTCSKKLKCDALKTEMLMSPMHFNHFVLLLSFTTQTSQTRETVIKINNVRDGQMMSKLLQKFPTSNIVHLTAEDEQKLLEETKTNIMIESFDESDVTSDQFSNQIFQFMKELLESSTVQAQRYKDQFWKSVFWNDDNYRPDKLSRQMNEEYDKADAETRKLIIQSHQNSKSFKIENSVNILGGTASFGAGHSTSNENSYENDVSNRKASERKKHVEWDGQQFTPKPMSLSRVNLGKLRDKKSFQDRKISVQYSTAVLSMAIKITEDEDATPSIITELIQKVNQSEEKKIMCKILLESVSKGRELQIELVKSLSKTCNETNKEVKRAVEYLNKEHDHDCSMKTWAPQSQIFLLKRNSEGHTLQDFNITPPATNTTPPPRHTTPPPRHTTPSKRHTTPPPRHTTPPPRHTTPSMFCNSKPNVL